MMALAPLVIKVGGNELSKQGFIEELAQSIAYLNQKQACILVHGGGRTIDDLLIRLGAEVSFIDGQRVTDEATLAVVEMALSGQVNKQLVRALLAAGIDALGVSGVDRGLLRAEPHTGHMGRVGRIVQVRRDVICDWMADGVVPVISPISLGADGPYNVNADHAAGAVAAAVGASQTVFITNMPGVLAKGEVLQELAQSQIESFIADGTIHSGMIPKVRAALDMLDSGVPAVLITDLTGLRMNTGTRIIA